MSWKKLIRKFFSAKSINRIKWNPFYVVKSFSKGKEDKIVSRTENWKKHLIFQLSHERERERAPICSRSSWSFLFWKLFNSNREIDDYQVSFIDVQFFLSFCFVFEWIIENVWNKSWSIQIREHVPTLMAMNCFTYTVHLLFISKIRFEKKNCSCFPLSLLLSPPLKRSSCLFNWNANLKCQ